MQCVFTTFTKYARANYKVSLKHGSKILAKDIQYLVLYERSQQKVLCYRNVVGRVKWLEKQQSCIPYYRQLITNDRTFKPIWKNCAMKTLYLWKEPQNLMQRMRTRREHWRLCLANNKEWVMDTRPRKMVSLSCLFTIFQDCLSHAYHNLLFLLISSHCRHLAQHDLFIHFPPTIEIFLANWNWRWSPACKHMITTTNVSKFI